MTTGRPSKYNSKYCKDIVAFFDMEPYQERDIPHYNKDGSVRWTDIKRMPNTLPTLRNFAKKIKVNISTIYNWLDPEHASFHQEFLDAFTQAKDLQKWFLIENGLNGLYNPAFAIFVATNITDMKNKEVKQHEGKDGGPIQISARFNRIVEEITGE